MNQANTKECPEYDVYENLIKGADEISVTNDVDEEDQTYEEWSKSQSNIKVIDRDWEIDA